MQEFEIVAPGFMINVKHRNNRSEIKELKRPVVCADFLALEPRVAKRVAFVNENSRVVTAA